MKVSYNKIKVAMIGFGGMANWHYRNMTASGIFVVIGVYDISQKAKDKAKSLGLISYNSAQELLDDKSIETVLVATPNDVHEEYVCMALNNGKNVICEKPVTLSSASLQRMIDTSKENNKVFTVHQNRRWDKDYLIIKSIYESRDMGGLYKLDSNVTGSHGLPGEWRCIKAKGGGMLWDWGVHLIDQIINLHTKKVVGVTCKASYVYGYDCDDGIYMTIDFEDGFVANINLDTNKFIATPRWYAYGLEGTAVIKGWNCKGKIIKVLNIIDTKNKGIQAGNGFTKTMAGRSKSTIMVKRLPKVKFNKYEFYNNFYECIRGNAKQVITNESVMRCMLVMEAGFKSINEQITVKVSI